MYYVDEIAHYSRAMGKNTHEMTIASWQRGKTWLKLPIATQQ